MTILIKSRECNTITVNMTLRLVNKKVDIPSAFVAQLGKMVVH